MKLLLAMMVTLVSTDTATNNEVEMILVPKATAETLVQENLRQQTEIEQWRQLFETQRKRIDKLQSATNCI